ncbi:MAG: hypothetical protein KC777_15265 [Cyanobacteria bacterium HKST-UBA02]|nr:hypothetical protein [Cyanobacteria bacterium HKST-UBA02]
MAINFSSSRTRFIFRSPAPGEAGFCKTGFRKTGFRKTGFREIAYLLLAIAILAVVSTTASEAAGSERGDTGKPSLIDKLEPMPIEHGHADESTDDTAGDTVKKEKDKEQDKPITVFEDQDEEDEDLAPTGDVDVYLSVAVPHTRNVVVKGMAYPYPPKMPLISSNMLPDDDKSIKELLMGSGYLRRQTANQPNPLGGWRWQYAFNKAVKKSRLTFPHSIVEHYRWSNAMVKFIRPEIQQINRFEKQRLAKYQLEESFFTEHSEIIKHDSARRGLDPVAIEVLPASPKRLGLDMKVRVARAKWWFTVDYTVPGLTYHWRIIRDLAKEKPERLILNEGNAISIEGGW